jgi:hypothetical protein
VRDGRRWCLTGLAARDYDYREHRKCAEYPLAGHSIPSLSALVSR